MLLGALLGAGIGQAKQQGWKASTISNLKQLSYASVLYTEQYESDPESGDKLVDVGMLKPSMVATRLDKAPTGLGNYHRLNGTSRIRFAPREFKYSILSFREEFGFDDAELMQEWRMGEMQGLYIIPTFIDGFWPIDPRRSLIFVRSFLRVNQDGSVVSRGSQEILSRGGASICLNAMWFFADFPQSYREYRCLGIRNSDGT